jgi:CheY-like chemotaxis protein
MMTDTDDGTAVVVLVAEDETLVRLLANDILTEAGYRVLEARDGQEALTVLEVHGDVRALITDVSMPNVDGISLANIVRKRWPHIAVVVTSGAMPDTKPLRIPDFARLVPKPYTPEKLVREVKAALADVADQPASAAPVTLTSIPNLHAGQMHGAGGLAQPLAEPDE